MPSCHPSVHGGTPGITASQNESHTNLSPNHLRQRADKLRRSINPQLDRFLIDNASDGEPEGGLEALDGVSGANTVTMGEWKTYLLETYLFLVHCHLCMIINMASITSSIIVQCSSINTLSSLIRDASTQSLIGH